MCHSFVSTITRIKYCELKFEPHHERTYSDHVNQLQNESKQLCVVTLSFGFSEYFFVKISVLHANCSFLKRILFSFRDVNLKSKK